MLFLVFSKNKFVGMPWLILMPLGIVYAGLLGMIMYKRIARLGSELCHFTDYQPCRLPPMRIDVGDIVSLTVSEQTDFYIKVDDFQHSWVRGVLIAIGPEPERQYQQWLLGDRLEVSVFEPLAIVRKSNEQQT